ncbi:type II secretion system F family protein [Cellulomonas sp. P24]|uniref:type II secretion system F family protein n=1 Tax=Cellulomonas sp. P24 TaxID=2885206 RepID=UPI00216ABE79|nr:type II secretion system F family protein [Cellulomonas sp. P24]MCR6492111.1 type II secretion system F family protein [Cellulomonas sp. P24]
MSALLAGVAGALLTAGGLAILVGARRTTASPLRRRRRRRPARPTPVALRTGWARWRWPVALGAGALVWLLSRWPVAGAIVSATLIGLPVLLSTTQVAARGIDRIEAIEEWTRRLADILLAGVGLEQGITTSLRTCPPPIAPEVTALVARLSARWTTEQALRAFADDLNDAAADLVVAALVLASRRRGPGLARVLTAVADSVADDVAVRRKVEAERAKPRTTARAVTLITLGVVGAGALNGTYLAPYGDPIGQLVLALIAGGFIGCLAWMRALTLSPPEPRFLTVSHRFTNTEGDGVANSRGWER